MNNPITFAGLWKQVKRLFVLWLVLAIVAALAVSGWHYLTLPSRFNAAAVVSFTFEGIENGQDPNGNWFDVSEMADPEIITAAAQSAGIGLEEGEAEKIASHLLIEGTIPDGVISRITELSSAYTDEKLSASAMEQTSGYFPTQYNVTLEFGELGYDPAKGNALLRAILETYETEFCSRYGFNAALAAEVKAGADAGLDFADAAERIGNSLDLMDRYVTAHLNQNTAAFRSKATDMSFQDLKTAIAKLKNQDLSQFTFFVTGKGISRNVEQLKQEYEYRLTNVRHSVITREEYVKNLTALIDGYVKKKTVMTDAVSVVVTAVEEGDPASSGTGVYEIPVESDIYNTLLVGKRVVLQQEQAEDNEKISLYQNRLQHLGEAVTESDLAWAEEELARISAELCSLTDKVQATADEYYRTEILGDAFRVLSFEEGTSFSLRKLISASLADWIAAEAFVLGLFMLIVYAAARREAKRTNSEEEEVLPVSAAPSTEGKTALTIDLVEITNGLKRFLAGWLALAVGCGALAAGVGIFMRRTVYGGDVKALMELSLLETDGSSDTEINVDVTRLQNAAVVGEAMNRLGLSLGGLDTVRRGISMVSVMSSEQYDQVSLYRSLLSKNSANLEVIQSMMDTSLVPTTYIISLNYRETGYNRRTAIRLLDEIIRCYREDFERENSDLGSLAARVAGMEYDSGSYAERVNALRKQLEEIIAYLEENIYFQATGRTIDAMSGRFDSWMEKNSEKQVLNFRSVRTGYTLPELIMKAKELKDLDLQIAAACVNGSGIAHTDTEKVHYQWLVDEAVRKRDMLQSRYKSLTESIFSFQRAVRVYSMTSAEQTGIDAYDQMVSEAAGLLEEIAGYNTEIRYYNNVIALMDQQEASSPEESEKADAMMKELSGKVSSLMNILTATAEEYNECAVRRNDVQIRVPANARPVGLTDGNWKTVLIILEVLLLVGWICAGAVYGIKRANPGRRKA